MKFLLLLLLIPSVSAVPDVCNEVFYFLIANEGEYMDIDVHSLTQEISQNITYDEIMDVLENFETVCDRNLPFETNMGTINTTINQNECGYEINKTIFGIYVMDTSIPLPEIHQGLITCSNAKTWRWVLRIEDGLITGIKIYWFLFPAVLYLLLRIIKETKAIDNALKS